MDYTLIRSKTRRRSLALSVTATGEVIVRAPTYTPRLFIDQFVRTKSDWISKRQAKVRAIPKPTQCFAKSELELFIKQKVARYADILALYPTEIRFKKVKSYWGNCHSSGCLTFNYALQYAPASAVEYVVVHELAHLRYKGHGKRFWALVNNTYPQAQEMRKILRKLPHITM